MSLFVPAAVQRFYKELLDSSYPYAPWERECWKRLITDARMEPVYAGKFSDLEWRALFESAFELASSISMKHLRQSHNDVAGRLGRIAKMARELALELGDLRDEAGEFESGHNLGGADIASVTDFQESVDELAANAATAADKPVMTGEPILNTALAGRQWGEHKVFCEAFTLRFERECPGKKLPDAALAVLASVALNLEGGSTEAVKRRKARNNKKKSGKSG
jgi:hypothetical protein